MKIADDWGQGKYDISGFLIINHKYISYFLSLSFLNLEFKIRSFTMAWEQTAQDKKARIAATIPQEWRLKSEPTGISVMDYPKKSGIMSAEELAITESSAVDLVAKMAEGQLTSVAVTTAFCKRAALATQLVRQSPERIQLPR